MCKRWFDEVENMTYQDSEQEHYKCPACGEVYIKDSFGLEDRTPYDDEAEYAYQQAINEKIGDGFGLIFRDPGQDARAERQWQDKFLI